MQPQPAGTVTFLFTDIEGSTRLLDELGADRYREALDQHRRLLRDAFERHGGYEVDYEGDAFFVAFASARDAVAAAAEAKDALTAAEWPDGRALRVRVGIHTGEALLDPPKYVGLAVHHAARVMSAGHGGQILLTQATRELVDVELRDLGDHRLKDLARPIRLFQLGSEEFPPLKSLNQTNLPVAATPLVGREAELRNLLGLVRRDGVRLLTMTGVGGTGKTRLAIQLAAEVVDEYPAGVWWVPLAALRDPAVVLPTVAQAVGAPGGAAEHFGDAKALLLLDNLEQVIEAGGELASLLAACPRLTLLVTSREALRVRGEHLYPVPPLVHEEAVELFTERGRAVDPSFVPGGAVAEICRRLEGLPLALELAAARVAALDPGEILARLERRLPLLTGGVRDAPERQRTLRATIEWSHDLLSPEEQRLFARLAVFAGGFTLEAAEAVCGADLDCYQSLHDKSLVRRQAGTRRSFMFETIREFASERLEQSADAREIRDRHCEFFVAAAEVRHQDARDGRPGTLDKLELDHDNFRAALSWALESGAPRPALELVWLLQFFWIVRGHAAEGYTWAKRALRAGAELPAADRLKGLMGAGELARFVSDFPEAVRLKEESIEIMRQQDPRDEYIAATLSDLAHVETERGNLPRARELATEGLALRRELGSPTGIAHARGGLAIVDFAAGNFESALRGFLKAAPAFEAGGWNPDRAMALVMAGQCARRLGDLATAQSYLSQGLTLAVDVGLHSGFPECLQELGALAVTLGRHERGAVLLGASERLATELGTPAWDPHDREGQAAAARAALGDAAFAAGLERGRALSRDEAVAFALSAEAKD